MNLLSFSDVAFPDSEGFCHEKTAPKELPGDLLFETVSGRVLNNPSIPWSAH